MLWGKSQTTVKCEKRKVRSENAEISNQHGWARLPWFIARGNSIELVYCFLPVQDKGRSNGIQRFSEINNSSCRLPNSFGATLCTVINFVSLPTLLGNRKSSYLGTPPTRQDIVLGYLCTWRRVIRGERNTTPAQAWLDQYVPVGSEFNPYHDW